MCAEMLILEQIFNIVETKYHWEAGKPTETRRIYRKTGVTFIKKKRRGLKGNLAGQYQK